MNYTTDENTICPLKLTMDLIGGKWKLSIICLLKDGKPMRYNHIKKNIPGITNMMLAQSLKQLEEYNVIVRKQYNEVPVRVEYQLTQNGFDLLSVLNLLSDWGNQYIKKNTKYLSHCSKCIMK